MPIRLITAGILAVVIVGCATTISPSTLTPSRPDVSVAAQPTLMPHEWFDCWNTVSRSPISTDTSGTERLVVAFGSYNELNLLQTNLAGDSRSLIASKVQNYYRPNPQEIVSPNGLYLWYSIFDPTLRSGIGAEVVVVHNLVNGTSQRIPFKLDVNTVGDTVAWSPNSECLVLWSNDIVTAYRLSDGLLLVQTIPNVDFDFNVSPSPDGHWWAWACNGNGGICVSSPQGMMVQGSGLRIPVDIDRSSGYPYFRGLVQWSPQGDILAFAYAGKSRTIMDTVRLVHVENGRFDEYEEIKAKALSLQWSPDGSELLIAGSDLQVYDLAAKSTKKLRYPEKSPSSIRPTWSFDGKKIAFIGANGSRLYVMNTSDESVSEIPLATNINGLSSSQSIYHVFWVP